MNVVMQLINAKRLQMKLNALGKMSKSRKLINKAAREAAKPLYTATKAAAPKRTGLLIKSVKLRAARKSRTRFGVNVIIRSMDFKKAVEKGLTRGKGRKHSTEPIQLPSGYWKVGKSYYKNKPYQKPKKWKVFYAGFVELGTKKIKARHWMKKVAKANRNQVMNAFTKRLFQLLKEAAGRPA